MWYFAWILGLPLAVCFAVLNAMWYEMLEGDDQHSQAKSVSPIKANPRLEPMHRFYLKSTVMICGAMKTTLSRSDLIFAQLRRKLD
ncbi:protein YbgT-related protein [Frigidibacter mobilis]|uniref:Protein YbgT-related protein n=1 Tax=Frigidibacter mobilis TaxID=1335048 RepID=A0A159Z748_9RHOB|nr:protein YbgT-related protein [Frigidibacter mobilis]